MHLCYTALSHFVLTEELMEDMAGDAEDAIPAFESGLITAEVNDTFTILELTHDGFRGDVEDSSSFVGGEVFGYGWLGWHVEPIAPEHHRFATRRIVWSIFRSISMIVKRV